MKKNRWIWVSFLVFLSVPGWVYVQKKQEAEASNTSFIAMIKDRDGVKGTVDVQIPEETSLSPGKDSKKKPSKKLPWINAEKFRGKPLPVNTRISTGMDSSLSLSVMLLNSGKIGKTFDVLVGEMTLATLSSVVANPTKYNLKGGSPMLKVKLGEFKVDVGKEGGSGTFEISTPSATASVTGTELSGTYTPDLGGKYNVEKGTIHLQTHDTGKSVNVGSTAQGHVEQTNDQGQAPAEVKQELHQVIVQPIIGATQTERQITREIGSRTDTLVIDTTNSASNIQTIVRRIDIQPSSTPLPAPPSQPSSTH